VRPAAAWRSRTTARARHRDLGGAVLTALVVAAGDLVQAAALTDAAVLSSSGLVNASLLWLARESVAQGRRQRTADVVVSGAALLMYGVLGLHVGWLGAAGAVALVAIGMVLGRAARSAT
jgi:hypothetical protein